MKSIALIIAAAVFAAIGWACMGSPRQASPVDDPSVLVGTHPGGIGLTETLKPKGKNQLAAFSGGCFWGTEYTFRHMKGVVATAVGYTGGTVANPTYEMVSDHTTGHAETCLVEFDPAVVTYSQLLHTFWLAIDPTTVDRQGPDIGNNYRSAIWTFGDDQMKEALASKEAEEKLEKAHFVTEIKPVGKFWLAEDYHQQYDQKTGTNSCPAPRRVGK